jgi:hypothetical protein
MDIVQPPNRPGTLRRSRVRPATFGLLATWLIAVFPEPIGEAEAREAQPAILILDQSAGLPAYQDIIASMVDTHGGRISIAPGASQGTVFTASLPQAEGQSG